MNKLRLILGDQLNINHSWFKENNSKTTYVLMEVKEETRGGEVAPAVALRRRRAVARRHRRQGWRAAQEGR